ncbi:MAG: carboxypeptidase regulatory-like domain-containing protein [Pyrinomonadaceae bacterium]
MTTHRRIVRSLSGISALLLLPAFLAVSASAQTNKGSIKGTVTDQNGGIVQRAAVSVINQATGTERTATSGDDGTYEVPLLDPGTYRITVKAQGFQDTVNENVIVQTSSTQVVDLTLTAGQVGGVVTVTAAAPLVESETSDLGSVITGKQVTDLPLPQRNFTLLATLSPGVTRPVVGVLGGSGSFQSNSPVGSSTEGTRFRESGGSVLVVNGARPTNNNFTLDGVDNNEGQFGQIGIFPPPDAIAEFKIQTSVPPAEGGRAGGGIINSTTRSGGNGVHGTAYEFYQGRVLSALGRNERGQAFIPNKNTHQFGFTVGGPVFLPRPGEGGPMLYDGRNRSFWYGYYEGQRNATPAFGGTDFPFVTVPTARQRVGDFSELFGTGNRTFNLTNGTTVTARVGTVFCPNLTPAPGNDIRNCGVPLSPSALATLQAYPLPTETGLLVNNYRRNRKEKYNRDGWGLRFDHRISNSDSMFLAYSKDSSLRLRDNNFPLGSSPNGNDLPSGFGAGEEFGNSRGVRLGETHTFSPTVINDFRFGATRVNIGINNPGINGALGFDPNVSARLGQNGVNVCGQCEGVVLLGIEEPLFNSNLEFIGDGGPFYFLSNNFSFADGLTWVRNAHTLKFGADYRIRQNSNFDGGRNGGMKGNVQYGSSTGGFLSGNYNGLIGNSANDSGSGLANFLLGYSPAFITRGTPGGPYFQSNKELSFFGQDDWKVNPTLTLNLGLRWDLFTQPTERFDRQTNYNPATDTLTRAGEDAAGGRDLVNSDKNNFGPRIGFAWSGLRSDKSMVIRGGYGLLYAVDIPGIPGILSTNPPGGANYSCGLSSFGTAGCPQLPARFNFDTGYPFPPEVNNIQPGQTFAAAAGTNLVSVNPNVQNEMFHEWNIFGQWEFRPNWLAEAGYVGNRGRNLLVVHNIGNQSSGGFPGSRQVTTHPVIQALDYIGKSWYNALQTKVERRFTRGLSIISTYVWSHAEDLSPGAFCGGGTGPSTCGFSNPLRPEIDKATADFDVPHRFTFAAVWDLPFGRDRRWASGISRPANLLIGGWQLNTNITVQSGPPFSIFSNGVRADIATALTSGCKAFEGKIFCPATTPVFANDPGGAKFGNSPRNGFRGARQEYVDASLFKNLRFAENLNVQLRVQAYNLFNHLNGYRPVNDLGNNDFGRDTAEQLRRQLEFGLRIIF